MRPKTFHVTFMKLVAALALGCSQESATVPTPNIDREKYFLAEEPEGARGVMALREEAQDNDKVVVVGRLGGGLNPWIEGLAAFVLLDASFQPDCEEDEVCEEGCTCCAEDAAKCSTIVKFTDEQGRVLPIDARQLLGVSELQTVVVSGTAKRDEAGNLTVMAKGIYIRR